MPMMNYELEEFTRARYWQEKYLELERRFDETIDASNERNLKLLCQELGRVEKRYEEEVERLKARIQEYEVRLNEHREDMEAFNGLPWYEKIMHKFDLKNM